MASLFLLPGQAFVKWITALRSRDEDPLLHSARLLPGPVVPGLNCTGTARVIEVPGRVVKRGDIDCLKAQLPVFSPSYTGSHDNKNFSPAWPLGRQSLRVRVCPGARMTRSDCPICDNKMGLSILLVRPSAIAIDPEFAPAEAEKLQPHEPSVKALGLPALQKSRHVLRMLRQGGFVHVFHTKPVPYVRKAWQAYRVQGSGALVPEDQVAWPTKPDFACSMRDSHPNDVHTLCIQFPMHGQASPGPVWVGFSMNWWDDAMRERVQANPAAAGMVRIDPLVDLGGVPNAFKADTDLIHKHVADFALRSMNHGGLRQGYNYTKGGVESATLFHGSAVDGTYRGAASLVAIMQKQAAHHEQTRGKEFVLVLPDPVGLAADLNGIRMARDQAFKDAMLKSTEAWPMASHATLNALQAARLAVEAGAQAAIKRFAGRRAVVVVAGAIVGGMEASVAGFAIASIVSGVGLVLLGAGIMATLIAMHELTPLEKWASRSYFGKGRRGPKFADGKQEQAQLDEALAPPEPVGLPTPVPYPTPAYDPRQQGPVQRKSS